MGEEKYLKRQRIYKTIMLVLLTAFLTFILTTTYVSNNYNLGERNQAITSLFGSSENDELLKSINEIKEILDESYLYQIFENDISEGALKGYVAGLDEKYTEYIPIRDMQDYTQTLMGNFVGIGIYMVQNVENNTIEVVEPIKESPAEEVGILPGDVIVAVDGVEYKGEDIDTAASKIKGEEGTTVELKILRGEETINLIITRRRVSTNPVISKRLENNIGYIQMTSFDEDTSATFKTKFEELKKEGIKSLIIDLRDNGGGLVDQTLETLDYIVPKGNDLLITIDKNKNEEIKRAEDDVLIDMPIVVLVNGNSASASEIFAGALKDLDEATIVGTKTFGKGVIQQLMTLKNGGGLKFTVAEYYTPKRNQINGIGIEPDVVVELPEDSEEDTQLQKAIELLK